MRLSYHSETESLYIGVADGVSAECVEICDGVVLDYDSNGVLVGIDIDQVSSLPQVLKIPGSLTIPTDTPNAQDSSDD